MFAELTMLLKEFIVSYGFFGVFFGSILEEIIAPIPSSAVIMVSSLFIMDNSQISLQAFGRLFLYIAVPAALGVTLGSLLFYGIVYKVGKPFVDRWGKYLGLSWEEVEKTEEKYSKHNLIELSIFTARALPILPSILVSASCGFIKYDIKKFTLLTFSGTLVKAFVFGLIAWQLGSVYNQIESKFTISGEIVITGLIIAIVGFIIHKKCRYKS